eukprot:4978376-Ditylum_brightwellii.AAC.1
MSALHLIVISLVGSCIVYPLHILWYTFKIMSLMSVHLGGPSIDPCPILNTPAIPKELTRSDMPNAVVI